MSIISKNVPKQDIKSTKFVQLKYNSSKSINYCESVWCRSNYIYIYTFTVSSSYFTSINVYNIIAYVCILKTRRK